VKQQNKESFNSNNRPQIKQQHTHANWLQSSMKKNAKKWITCKAQRKNKCKESRKAWQT
jgi:hypothetical protein